MVNDNSSLLYVNPGSEVEIESSVLIGNSSSNTITNYGGFLTITNSSIENTFEFSSALYCCGEHETYLDHVMLKAPAWPLYAPDQPVDCTYGLFNIQPGRDFLSSDCTISENTDPVTKGIYPYLVSNGDLTALQQAPRASEDEPKEYISLSGQKSMTPHPGINIVNGRKVLMRK